MVYLLSLLEQWNDDKNISFMQSRDNYFIVIYFLVVNEREREKMLEYCLIVAKCGCLECKENIIQGNYMRVDLMALQKL